MNVYDQLRRDEGVRAKAYPDPLSKGPPWTIGVGHTGPEVHEGLLWDDDQIEAALVADVAKCCAQLDQHVTGWRVLEEPRQAVLIGMCFNLGINGLLKFKKFLAAVMDARYHEAASEMLDSAWATQVGARAQRLATQMSHGIWV